MKRHARDLNRWAAAHGFAPAEQTGGGHLRFRHRSGALVFVSSTPSDRNERRAVLALFRRAARRSAGAA